MYLCSTLRKPPLRVVSSLGGFQMKSLEEKERKNRVSSSSLLIWKSLKKATPPGVGVPTITEHTRATYNMNVPNIILIYVHILTRFARRFARQSVLAYVHI